jgi:hypothetical protein
MDNVGNWKQIVWLFGRFWLSASRECCLINPSLSGGLIVDRGCTNCATFTASLLFRPLAVNLFASFFTLSSRLMKLNLEESQRWLGFWHMVNKY